MIGGSWETAALGPEFKNEDRALCTATCIDRDFVGPVNCAESCEMSSHSCRQQQPGSSTVKISDDVVGQNGCSVRQRKVGAEAVRLKGRKAGSAKPGFRKSVSPGVLLRVGVLGSNLYGCAARILLSSGNTASHFSGVSRTLTQIRALLVVGVILGVNVAVIEDQSGKEIGEFPIKTRDKVLEVIANQILNRWHPHAWLTMNGTYKHTSFNEKIRLVGKSLLCAQVSSTNSSNPQFTAIDLGAVNGSVRVEYRNGLPPYADPVLVDELRGQRPAFSEWCLPIESDSVTTKGAFIDELENITSEGWAALGESGSVRTPLPVFGKNPAAIHVLTNSTKIPMEGLETRAGHYHGTELIDASSECDLQVYANSSVESEVIAFLPGTTVKRETVLQSFFFNTCEGGTGWQQECLGYEVAHGREDFGQAVDVSGTGVSRQALDIRYISKPGITDDQVLRGEEVETVQTSFEDVTFVREKMTIGEHSSGGTQCRVRVNSDATVNNSGCIQYTLTRPDSEIPQGYGLDSGEEGFIGLYETGVYENGPDQLFAAGYITRYLTACGTKRRESWAHELRIINKLLQQNSADADAERINETDVPEILGALLTALVGAHLSRKEQVNAFRVIKHSAVFIANAFMFVVTLPVEFATAIGCLRRQASREKRELLVFQSNVQEWAEKSGKMGSIIGLGLLLGTLAIPNVLYVVNETKRALWTVQSRVIDSQYVGKTVLIIPNHLGNVADGKGAEDDLLVLDVPLQAVTLVSAERTALGNSLPISVAALGIYSIVAVWYIMNKICRYRKSLRNVGADVSTK